MGVDARNQLDFARALVEKYVDGEKAIPSRSLGSLADFSWSLCSLELGHEYTAELKDAMTTIFERSPPQNRVPLVKLFDVICALGLEYQSLGVTVPQLWKAACDDADRFEM